MDPTIFFYITMAAFAFFVSTFFLGHGHVGHGSHFGGGHHGFGGHHSGVGHVHTGHVGTHSSHNSDSKQGHLSFVSFRTFTLFVAGFGAGGYFAAASWTSKLLILGVAILSGLALGWLGYALLKFLLKGEGGYSGESLHSYVDVEARVSVTIAANGIGCISTSEFGTYQTFQAVSKDNQTIPLNAQVRIVAVKGSTAVVEPINSQLPGGSN